LHVDLDLREKRADVGGIDDLQRAAAAPAAVVD
jgi:hypothetical protein